MWTTNRGSCCSVPFFPVDADLLLPQQQQQPLPRLAFVVDLLFSVYFDRDRFLPPAAAVLLVQKPAVMNSISELTLSLSRSKSCQPNTNLLACQHHVDLKLRKIVCSLSLFCCRFLTPFSCFSKHHNWVSLVFSFSHFHFADHFWCAYNHNNFVVEKLVVGNCRCCCFCACFTEWRPRLNEKKFTWKRKTAAANHCGTWTFYALLVLVVITGGDKKSVVVGVVQFWRRDLLAHHYHPPLNYATQHTLC